MKTRCITLRKALPWCCTALASLQLAASGATIANRWSFNEAACINCTTADSVGQKTGQLLQGASLDGLGSCVLSNGGNGFVASSNVACQYLAFPADLVTGYTAITVETWFRPEFNSAAFMDWNRLWDFGDSFLGVATNGYFFFRAGSTAYGIGGAIMTSNLNWQGQYPAGALLSDQQWNHVVWCSDGVSGKLRIYTNGILCAAYDNFTNTPALAGPTPNCWLGRSQFDVDRALDADYDEFRIYDGMLTPLEVAANFQYGPNSVSAPASYGTVTNLTLVAYPNMLLGTSRTVQLLAWASGLTNQPIDIRDAPGVTYTSGDTNVLTIDPYGTVTGVGAGTANVVAQFASLSSTQSVNVIAIPTTLLHRYSFSENGGTTVNDSVGTAHGTLSDLGQGASIGGGQLNLMGAQYEYVYLPEYLLASSNILHNAVTFQAWVSAATNNDAFPHVFDFGNTLAGNGATYIYFTPNILTNGGNTRAGVSDASPGFMNEELLDGPNILGQTDTHVAVVWNPGAARKFFGLYINGTLVDSMTTTIPYSGINNVYSYIGRSTWDNDPYLNGSINEFRIYDGELDRVQIAASYQYGPNSTNLAIGNFVSFSLDRGAPTIPLEQSRQASSCIINFQFATNVNVLGDTGLTLTSSDTNVVSITSPAGVIRANGLGSATLTAIFRYATFTATNFYTNSAAITTVIPSATLVHRYSFNETSGLTVTDSVGGAHGLIQVGTNTLGTTNYSWTGGLLYLNTSGTLWDTYVDLPDGIISKLTNNATFETWVYVGTALWSNTWARIFDFGSVPGEPDIFLTRRYSAANMPRFDWLTGFMDSSAVIASGTAHFVVLYDDADNSAVMYLNGNRVAQSSTATSALGSLNDTNNWLARSHFSFPYVAETNADPYFRCRYDEFRIYSGLLTEPEIKRNYALGPNQPVTNVPLYFSVSAGNLAVKWPTYAARFTLESSPAVGPGASWTPVGGTVTQVGTNYQMTVPMTGAAQYFGNPTPLAP